MSYKEFVDNETNILTGISQRGFNSLNSEAKGLITKLPEEGLSQVGYLIALTHDDYVKNKIGDFAEEVARRVGGNAITYGRDNAHQTIADARLETVAKGSFSPDKSFLTNLVSSAKDAFHKYNDTQELAPWTVFGDYLLGDDSVVLAPKYNSGNYELINMFADAAQRNKIETRAAWGRHSTDARFNSNVSPELSKSLINFMYFPEGDAKNSFPSALTERAVHFAKNLTVGYFEMNREEFKLTPVEILEF